MTLKMAIYLQCAILLFVSSAWAATFQSNAFVPATDFDYRPFGSNRPCSALVNETMAQNSGQIIIERILTTADTMGNTFSSSLSSFTPQASQQLQSWASQVCGQMQNAVGYLKTVCQYSASDNSPNGVVAQLKLRAMSAAKDYLCNNDALSLKEIAINNGAQCVRRTNMADFGCRTVPGSPNPTGLGLDPTARFATAIILTASSYGSETCRYMSDITNCIMEKYSRGTDFCNPRVTAHLSRIVSLMLQAVQCSGGGSFGTSTLPPFPNFNYNGFNNQHSGSFNYPSYEHPFNSNNNNQFQLGRYPQQGNGNFAQSKNDGDFGSNFGGHYMASERRTTTIPPWNRRTNSAPSSNALVNLVVVMAIASFLNL